MSSIAAIADAMKAKAALAFGAFAVPGRVWGSGPTDAAPIAQSRREEIEAAVLYPPSPSDDLRPGESWEWHEGIKYRMGYPLSQPISGALAPRICML